MAQRTRRDKLMTSVIDTNFASFAYTPLREIKFVIKHCRYQQNGNNHKDVYKNLATNVIYNAENFCN